MLSVITGKQRAGKTFYCVKLIKDYLKESTRHIYTNLPLNPDILCRYAAGKNHARYVSFLQRIHLFKDFRTLKEGKIFKLKNPDWCRMRQMHKQERILTFWEVARPNSVIMLDELYQWFSSADYRDQSKAEIRKKLLTYTRQHGHFKDDLYLISHNLADLDAHIRRGTQYLFEIRNSKYTNMFPWSYFRGLKWPVQFFMVSGFEYGESQPSDYWNVWPDKWIFRCYESFSQAETLGKGSADIEAHSTDTKVNHKKNFLNFLGQTWLLWSSAAVVVIAALVTINAYRNLRKPAALVDAEQEKQIVSETDRKSATHEQQNLSSNNNKVPEGEKEFIKCVTSNSVHTNKRAIYEGDLYKGFKVLDIEPDISILGLPDGRKVRIRTRGLFN